MASSTPVKAVVTSPASDEPILKSIDDFPGFSFDMQALKLSELTMKQTCARILESKRLYEDLVPQFKIWMKELTGLLTPLEGVSVGADMAYMLEEAKLVDDACAVWEAVLVMQKTCRLARRLERNHVLNETEALGMRIERYCPKALPSCVVCLHIVLTAVAISILAR